MRSEKYILYLSLFYYWYSQFFYIRIFPLSQPAVVHWSKDGSSLPETAIDDGRGFLIITNLKVSDSGRYICEAQDGYSIVTKDITVTVGSKYLFDFCECFETDSKVSLFFSCLSQKFHLLHWTSQVNDNIWKL